MAVDTAHASAGRLARADVERIALGALAGGLLAASVLFVVHRAGQPSDGTDVRGGAGIAFADDGVWIRPRTGSSGSAFEAGDRVTAIDGRGIEAWTAVLIDPAAARPDLAGRGEASYVVARTGDDVELRVPYGRPDLLAPLAREWGVLAFALSMQLAALYLFARRPAEPAARALLVAGTGLFASTLPWALGLQALDLVNASGFWLYAISVGVAYALFWSGVLHFALVFPRPLRFAAGRRRILVLAYVIPIGLQLALIAGAAVVTGRALPALAAWGTAQLVLPPTVIVVVLGLMVLGHMRLVRPAERDQLRWVGASVALAAIGSLALWFGPELATGGPLAPRSAVALLGLPLPLALGVTISRHHLFQIDVLVNRSVVYAALTIGTLVIYVATVGLVGGLVLHGATFAASLIGAGAAAVVVLPLRDRIQRAVDRAMYGDRADPYRAVRRLGQRLESSIDPRTVLPTLVATVAESMRLPYVAIELERDGETVASAATGARPAGAEPQPGLVWLPLTYQGERIGMLVVSQREPGERFGPADERLLADLARQVAPAAEAVRLTADLQRSREQLVTAREEERRRLRRDLHDGLGPALAASLMKLQAARVLADGDAERSCELLDELETETRRTIEDVRRIAYDLRPPALDELGLVGALRQHAANLSAAPGARRLDVHVDARDELDGQSAAVEVAGLRIALEALTNVARHSAASHARVGIRREGDDLVIEVTDDGRGMPADARAGIGLTSMRERAEELGGSLEVERPAGGGTRLVARLPDPRSPSTDTSPVTVVVADDHPLIRDGLRALLGATPGIELVGEATTGDEAVELVDRLVPRVILMDLAMPGRNGIEATREIAARHGDVAILILTMFEDQASIFAAIRAGARGYLLKDAGHAEVRRAIEAVSRGEALFGARIAQQIAGFFNRPAGRGRPFPDLTEREQEVLEELARGANNATISRRLGISLKTVRNHVSTILGKLMVADRSQAIVRAREAGLGVRAPEAPPEAGP